MEAFVSLLPIFIISFAELRKLWSCKTLLIWNSTEIGGAVAPSPSIWFETLCALHCSWFSFRGEIDNSVLFPNSVQLTNDRSIEDEFYQEPT